MGFKRKPWVWVLVISVSLVVVALVAMTVAVGFFFGRNVQVSSPSSAEAFRQFDSARSAVQGSEAALRLRPARASTDEPSLHEFPTASVKPHDLVVMAWDPDGSSPGVGRLVRIPLPFWLLQLGRQKIDLLPNESGVISTDSTSTSANWNASARCS